MAHEVRREESDGHARCARVSSVRNFGILLLLSGILGFFYCGDQVQRFGPVPEGMGLMQSFEHPAGRWETARYACAFGAALGFLLALFPKGR